MGVRVGVPAPVTEEGIVFGSANLGWKYKEVKKELEELTGFEVEVGNDANVAALGEMWKGGGAGYKRSDYGNAWNRRWRRYYCRWENFDRKSCGRLVKSDISE